MLANVSSQMSAAGGDDARRRAADAGNQLGEIADGRDRDRDVADPVAEPVDVVGLEAGVRAEEVARVGVRAARLRIELARASRNTSPSAATPTVAMTQPKMAMPPTCARLTGSRNTPVPIMLPATSIVACDSDILLAGLAHVRRLHPP